MKRKLSISLDESVFQKIEDMRGTKTQFRSEFINMTLREKLGIQKQVEK